MSYNWFKLYHDMPDDVKLRRFTPQEKWAWVALLCLASKSKKRGIVTADHDDIADYCEFNCTQDWLYFRDKLIAKGMIEINPSGNISITHWDDRQQRKPSDKPEAIRERVAKHRTKKKEEAVTPCNALHDESNADVTPQIRLDKTREDQIPSGVSKEKQCAFASTVFSDELSNVAEPDLETSVESPEPGQVLPVATEVESEECPPPSPSRRKKAYPQEFEDWWVFWCQKCDAWGMASGQMGVKADAYTGWKIALKKHGTVQDVMTGTKMFFLQGNRDKAAGRWISNPPHAIRFLKGKDDHPTPYWLAAMEIELARSAK